MQADYSGYGAEAGHTATMESYDPRQRRRRAGHTTALLMTALAIPGLIAAVVALGDRGGSGGGSDDPAPDPSYAAEPLRGDGFSYAVPTGWREATEWAREIAPSSAESAVTVSHPDDGFGTNVLVTAWSADGASAVEQARRDWFSVDYGRLQTLDTTSIDGERALGVRWEGRNDTGRRVVQIGYLALRGDRAYSIVLSAPAASEDDYLSTFGHLLDSWSWDDAPAMKA